MIIETTSQFHKDYKRVKKRGYDLSLLQKVIDLLLADRPLPLQYRDHALTGDKKAYRECHIQPDWLLMYRIERDRLILVLQRTGTHADLFFE